MASQYAEGISSGNRIEALDVIRGFALFGILVMNMPYFSQSFFAEMGGEIVWDSQIDRFITVVRDTLFSGKFNAMFCMLFAVGFTIQWQRWRQNNTIIFATTMYLRRLFWLFTIGIFHYVLLWPGDILHIYAVLGVSLLLFQRINDKGLIVLIVLGLFFPVWLLVYRYFIPNPEWRAQFIELVQQLGNGENSAYGAGSLFDSIRQNLTSLKATYSSNLFILPNVRNSVELLTTMLLGLLLGRREFFDSLCRNPQLIRRLQWLTLLVSVLFTSIDAAYISDMEMGTNGGVRRLIKFQCYEITRLATMSFYVLTLMRCLASPRLKKSLQLLIPLGRIPLTNYLLQSVIAVTLCYYWGFGLWGKISPLMSLLIAGAILFVIQLPLSHLWLNKFPLGPMEWLWRRLSYGKNR